VLPPNPTTAPQGGGVWREDVVLERIAALLGAPTGAAGAAGWGDDAAVLDRPAGQVLFCVDAAVGGVHLDLNWFPAADLGHRAAVATLSDVAAMGGRAVAVVVAVCAPGDVDVADVESGVIAACAASGCAVAGGDLSLADTLVVTVAAMGAAPPTGPVRRGGASAGDALFVTGPLGGSSVGLRARRDGADLDDAHVRAHRRPVARLAEGAAAAASGATAMIDVSDGLARDLRRLAAASSVGATLDDVPLAQGATLDDGLGGGEDYELVIAHRSPEALLDAFAAAGLRAPLRVGTVSDEVGVLTLAGAPLADVGWRHGG
jgi:thiamine-monophosphate kinase